MCSSDLLSQNLQIFRHFRPIQTIIYIHLLHNLFHQSSYDFFRLKAPCISYLDAFRCVILWKSSAQLAELLCIPGYTHTKQMPALNLPADRRCSRFPLTFSEASHPLPKLHVPQPVHLHGSASSDRSEDFPRLPDSQQNGSA